MSSTIPSPGRRDPEGRRRAIVAAAAELIAEGGADRLTHRSIAARASVSLGSTTQYFSTLDELREAALQQLADEVDQAIAEIEACLDDLDSAPELAAESMHGFLSNQRQVAAEIALMSSGATDPGLRALAQRWFDRLVAVLTPHIGGERATSIAVYVEGATVYAALKGESLSQAEIARTLRVLAGWKELGE